jgi:predicted tellurium resistance membrane protein TerC
VLGFVGFKMLATDIGKLPILASLGIIVGILTIATVTSLLKPPR